MIKPRGALLQGTEVIEQKYPPVQIGLQLVQPLVERRKLDKVPVDIIEWVTGIGPGIVCAPQIPLLRVSQQPRVIPKPEVEQGDDIDLLEDEIIA